MSNKEQTSQNSAQTYNQKNSELKDAKKAKIKHNNPFRSILVLTILDLICILGIIYLVYQLPTKASAIKSYKNTITNAEKVSKVEKADLEVKSVIDTSDKLLSLFPDEEGLIDFVTEIESLESEGSIKEFRFANDTPVKDVTGSYGIPFMLSLQGSWDQIDQDLQNIQALDYLIRIITFDAEQNFLENIVNVKMGGFIYVQKQYAENR